MINLRRILVIAAFVLAGCEMWTEPPGTPPSTIEEATTSTWVPDTTVAETTTSTTTPETTTTALPETPDTTVPPEAPPDTTVPPEAPPDTTAPEPEPEPSPPTTVAEPELCPSLPHPHHHSPCPVEPESEPEPVEPEPSSEPCGQALIGVLAVGVPDFIEFYCSASLADGHAGKAYWEFDGYQHSGYIAINPATGDHAGVGAHEACHIWDFLETGTTSESGADACAAAHGYPNPYAR